MWRSIPALLAITALTISVPDAGMAQTELLPGERFRILTQDGTSVTGTVVSTSSETLVLVSDGNERTIAFADIAWMERSAERYRKFWGNLLTTVGSIGAAVGFVRAVTWSPCSSKGLGCLFVPTSHFDALGQGFVMGGILALPVGVIVGHSLQYDRWEPVSLPELPGLPASTISLEPVFTGGLGLSASISF